ncbi:MAG TPA: VCBS repeat-containing protein [Terracidiphilus sp.]|jgi:hypothetical protein
MTFAQPIYGVADFNGDGRLDFLTGNVLMLQNSNGTFTAKQYTSVTSGYSDSAVADLNGDGKADIVTVNSAPADDHGDPISPATLTIYLGNGNGTFSAKTPFNLGGGVLNVWVLVSDVNHDGKPDIVTVSSDQYGDAFLQTFLNAGGGNFTAGPTYGSIGSLVGGNLYVAADFNGDGIPDLAVKNNFELQILIGKGDGSFTAGAIYNMNPYEVSTGDFNKDGHQDLVVVTAQSGTILLGQGNGSFTTGATLDTAFNTNVSSSQTPVAQATPVGLYVGDLNKDGKLDIALTSQSSTLTVATYLGNGNGTFSSPKAFNVVDDYAIWQLGEASPTAFADFNNDGKMDVMAEGSGTGVSALAMGDGSGGFKSPVISQTPNPGSIVTADFNHDGIDDIAVVNEPLCSGCTTTTVTVFLGTGKNYFGAPVTYTVPVSGGMIAAGDINNDGHIDLVVARNPQFISIPGSTDDVAVLLGRGDGTFETPVGYPLLGAPKAGTLNHQVYLVDVNKDGKLDLIGDWGVALGKGNGQFGAPIALPSTVSGSVVALGPGDFNNSGTIGLAVATNTYDAGSREYVQPSHVYVLAGNSNGTFHVVQQKTVSAFVTALITADLNSDHRTDILCTVSGGTASNPQLTLAVGLSVTGNYGFSQMEYTIAASDVQMNNSILTGDFNRDGNMDVAIPAMFQSTGALALLRGTGGGALNSSPSYYQGNMNQAVVLDVNGDGAPDIVGTTSIGVARLLNTGAH